MSQLDITPAEGIEPDKIFTAETDEDGEITGFTGRAAEIEDMMNRNDSYVLFRASFAHNGTLAEDFGTVGYKKNYLSAILAAFEGEDASRAYELAGKAGLSELRAEVENAATAAGFEHFPLPETDSIGPLISPAIALIEANYDVSLEGLVTAAHSRKSDIHSEWGMESRWTENLEVFAP